MNLKRLRPALLAAALGVGLPASALAHPHVFVVVRSELLLDAKGLVTGIRHQWTFDEMYSAFATTGLNPDGKPATPEQMQPLAEQNVDELTEFGYYTVVKSTGRKVEFGKAEAISMTEDDKKLVTLRFTIPLKTPASASKVLTLQVYDPTYFVSFDFDHDGVSLRGGPAGCSLSMYRPRSLDDAETQKLSEAFFSGLSPGADFGIKLATTARVACP